MQLTTEAFFRKPSQIISRDILQEASLAMYYWATDNKPDLTHSSHSVMKKWSFRVQFFFQSMIRWFQNLLVLNYSYAFESSFASASLIMLDYTLAHTWLYSWAQCVLSQAMVFRFHSDCTESKKRKKTEGLRQNSQEMWLKKTARAYCQSENRIQAFRVHTVSHFDMEINIDSSIKITDSLITRIIINTSDYDLHRFLQVWKLQNLMQL